MARPKRKADSYDKSDRFVVSDDDTPGAQQSRPSKKNKVVQPPNRKDASKARPSVAATGPSKDDEGNTYWEISKTRRVTVSDFKGNTMVSIREYYEKDGKALPGKKGITMTVDQYSALLSIIPNIEKVLYEAGEATPRPVYSDDPNTRPLADEDEDEERDDDNNGKKANHEATSDEDTDD